MAVAQISIADGVVAAIITAVLALLGVLITQMVSRSTSRRTERIERRREAAQALGPVLALIQSVQGSLSLHDAVDQNVRLEKTHSAVRKDWPAVRQKLFISLASDPAAEVASSTRALLQVMDETISDHDTFHNYERWERLDELLATVQRYVDNNYPLSGGLSRIRQTGDRIWWKTGQSLENELVRRAKGQ